MSFSCPHCGESNNEIRPAGPIQDKGIRIKTDIKDIKVSPFIQNCRILEILNFLNHILWWVLTRNLQGFGTTNVN